MLRRAHQIGVSIFISEVHDVDATSTQYGVVVILQKRENLDQTMNPGDFVISPSWTWHDHGNPSDAPRMPMPMHRKAP